LDVFIVMNRMVLNFDYDDWNTPREFVETIRNTISNPGILGFYMKSSGIKLPIGTNVLDVIETTFDLQEDKVEVTITFPSTG
jgi:hypothetical protein